MAWLAELRTETQAADDRGAPRRRLRLSARAEAGGDAAGNVLIHNLSATGLLLETSAPLDRGEVIAIELPETGATPAIVVWESGGFYGCRFISPVPPAVVSAAQLRSSWLAEPDYALAPAPPATLSVRHRTAAIIGLSLAAWALVGGAVWVLTAL